MSMRSANSRERETFSSQFFNLSSLLHVNTSMLCQSQWAFCVAELIFEVIFLDKSGKDRNWI